ncbi:protein FAM89A-like [Limulus polyphemus]|uniref:Protein FAM89A-like n=1 Tax=Limulus polyphemus TaxID=6850 RepID=A0ABM1BKK0_LIMPO|nr:protein FAM89A-like [Limulus polyphemus]XP_022251976.1 protein FAM89A-like [Limulus polyphemus]XP_022251977.1 protein FAM89A-like [Limulus polyphemus]
MASLQGLPPLPKSLSGLLNFSSSQWKELERLHAMRTMIQQDLSRNMPELASSHMVPNREEKPAFSTDRSTPNEPHQPRPSNRSTLDAQLAVLRKEMVGLRQLDMSLLCQLWSLNESIQEYKQLVQERMSASTSYASSPGWDNGLDSPSSEELLDINLKPFELQRPIPQPNRIANHLDHRDLASVPEDCYSYSNSSHSSLEFEDV